MRARSQVGRGLFSLLLGLLLLAPHPASLHCNKTELHEWLGRTDAALSRLIHNASLATFLWKINVTEDTRERMIRARTTINIHVNTVAFQAKEWLGECVEGCVLERGEERQLRRYGGVGIRMEEEEDMTSLEELRSTMTHTYGHTKICGWDRAGGRSDCGVQWALTPNISTRMARSIDYDELLHLWKEWHDRVGSAIKPLFRNMTELKNKGARADGFSDAGAAWRSQYETQDLGGMVEKLWFQILPLYEQLHTYFRRNLREIYPDRLDDISTIPAHLLGNLWGQNWSHNFRRTLPFPRVKVMNMNQAMRRRGYTPRKMFRIANDFFVSLGLRPVPPSFWNTSLLRKPHNRDNVICHPSAFDSIYAIVMCSSVSLTDLSTIHHEMGHIQYYLQYAHLPTAFRAGANPAFHEAIGDTIALSVTTPNHLRKLGLLSPHASSPTPQQDINFLYRTALRYVAFLPFGYILDRLRWEIFNHSLPYQHWNSRWTQLRYQYQGLSIPLNRSGAHLFDAGAKFHVPADIPYIRYFLSTILQFQFYRSLCNSSSPLHHCDFHGDKTTGQRLGDLLRLGASKHWTHALKNLTGRCEMSATPLLEYFRPLSAWLEKENRGHCFGWKHSWPTQVQHTLPLPRC